MSEAMMSKDPYTAEENVRWRAMMDRIKQDLGARGLTSGDLAGLEQDQHVERGALVGWTVRVLLNGDRPALVYTLDNRDGARVMHDGAALPDVVMQ